MSRSCLAVCLTLTLLSCQRPQPTATESSAGSEAEQPTNAAEPDVEQTADVEQTSDVEQASEFGTTDDDAALICEDTGIEDITTCSFVAGGTSLSSGGRVDLLELESSDPSMGPVTTIFLVIRTSEEPDYPVAEELTSAHSIPGEDLEYELAPLEVGDGRVSIEFEVVSHTHPNTGEPSGDPGTITERDNHRVTCTLHDAGWECERTTG